MGTKDVYYFECMYNLGDKVMLTRDKDGSQFTVNAISFHLNGGVYYVVSNMDFTYTVSEKELTTDEEEFTLSRLI